jgi:hypothetical protein
MEVNASHTHRLSVQKWRDLVSTSCPADKELSSLKPGKSESSSSEQLLPMRAEILS